MILRVPVKPDLLIWARERAGIEVSDLVRRFPKYLEWERGHLQPTLRQLEKLAKTTHAPIGAFFLSHPPEENQSVPDLRTVGNKPTERPSTNLRDVIYMCQQRQDWYREHAQAEGMGPVPFVGSVTLASEVECAAAQIRAALGFGLHEHRKMPSWTEALRRLVAQADKAGVLVMANSIVGSSYSRKLDPEEFRGFALVDEYAPLVFINGADSKAAQMITLAHELAHIWLGESGISNVGSVSVPQNPIEAWCSHVAAEILVPLQALRNEFREDSNLTAESARLARLFKVSTLVILRRFIDAGYATRQASPGVYDIGLRRIQAAPPSRGGYFHTKLKMRVGLRFGSALVNSTLAGQTSFTDAFHFLGIKKASTLRAFAESLRRSP